MKALESFHGGEDDWKRKKERYESQILEERKAREAKTHTYRS